MRKQYSPTFHRLGLSLFGEAIAPEYIAGASIKSLAEKYGLTNKRAIAEALRRAGVKVRSVGRPRKHPIIERFDPMTTAHLRELVDRASAP